MGRQRCESGGQLGLLADSECLIPYASATVGLLLSPSGNFAFLLSSEGRQPPARPTGLAPAPSPQFRAYGQHYLQLASMTEKRLLGRPLRIRLETYPRGVGLETLDWIGDDLIVVAPDSGAWLSIIHRSDFLVDDGS